MAAFKFLPFNELKQNIQDLIALELKEKKVDDINKLVEPRRSQLKDLNRVLAEFAKHDLNYYDRLDNVTEQVDHAHIDSEYRSQILTGALLELKDKIKQEYAGIWTYLRMTAEKNSLVYKNIDKTAGISDDNTLDNDQAASCKKAYQDFARMYGLNLRADIEKFNVEIYKSKATALQKPKPLTDRSQFASIAKLKSDLPVGIFALHSTQSKAVHENVRAHNKDDLNKVVTRSTDFMSVLRQEHQAKVQDERAKLREANEKHSEESVEDIQRIFNPKMR